MRNFHRFSAAFAGSIILSLGVSAADEITTYPADAFHNTTDYSIVNSPLAYSADGKKLLITANTTGVFNAYALDLDTNEQTALTHSDTTAVFGVSYMPDGVNYLYTYDQDGDELNHLYIGGPDMEPRDLTPGENLKAGFVGWVNNNSAFILQSNERDPESFDLYRYDANTYERTLIFENNLGLGGFVVSRDGMNGAAIKSRTSADDNIYLFSLTNSSEPQLITEHDGNISHVVYEFTPEGDKLVYGTDEHGEFSQAWTHNLSSGAQNPLIEADWDILYVGYSPSGRYRIHGVNNDASTEVSIYDRTKNKAVKLPKGLPRGELRNVRFAPDEKSVALIVNASRAPSNIFTAQLNKRKFKQHTQALNPQIDPDSLVSSQVIRYKSFDGLEIPAILYKPIGASADNPAPALVWVHGGPGGQTRTGYSATIQHLVNHGYAILGANNRGSSGYGKTYFHMDDKKHGEVDLQDIVYGRAYLEGLDWVDSDKVGIIGGSYGGYMVMAALAFEPEVFDVGINIFGVTNWVRTLKSIPPWWASFRESLYDELGDPETDEERHRRISPLFHADNVTKPVLVVQGANDPRVLQVESDEMVANLRENGVPVEYILFPDEGHGFRRRDNRITASDAYVKFLDQYLRGAE